MPEDISTPQSLQLPPLRISSRTLPRSPLFISQNAASSSPERRPVFALTPHVTSRVAIHNAPGIIFAQPPRRPPRRSPRHHRHQTNSFSFDSSERSSAAYEQQRASSVSTNDSIPRPSDDTSLHDELRGSSLQSSRNPSGLSHASRARNDQVEVLNQEKHVQNVERTRNFIFSSSQLPLPHPFSSVSRSPSPESPQSPAASPIRSDSSTAANTVQQREGSMSASPGADQRSVLNSSPPVSICFPCPQLLAEVTQPRTGFSPMSLLRQAQRVISAHRARSPLQRRSSPDRRPVTESRCPLSTPRQIRGSQRQDTEPQTPAQIRVYNDDISPETQPQTPTHLPESRHRSRYHPSYTAPVTRAAARRSRDRGTRTATAGRESPVDQRQGVRSTWRSFRQPRRAASPMGMMQQGFRGLYGGRENGDEEANWVEGVRFHNAETRLWGARDAQNEGRGLRETPEPEDWRVGRRS